MGKILSILGILFGVIGFLCAILLYLTLAALPRTIEDSATLQLTKVQTIVGGVEDSMNSTTATLKELEKTIVSLSDAIEDHNEAMVELGYGLDQISSEFSAVGIEIDKLESAAKLMKEFDVSNITTSVSSFKTKIKSIESSVEGIESDIGGLKTGIIKLRGDVEEISSLLSRAILLLSLFLMAVSISLIIYSVNGLKQGKKETKQGRE